MKNVIFLDFDDTLVHSGVHFWLAYAKFIEKLYQEIIKYQFRHYVATNVLSIGEIARKLYELESKLIPDMGYTPRRLSESFKLLAQEFLDEEGMKNIDFDLLGREPFEAELREICRNTKEILERMRELAVLVLWTRGDSEVQRRRVESTGLDVYFNYFFILKEKNALQLFRAICEIRDAKGDIDKVFMIGNSLQHDIQPALELGLIPVLISPKPFCHSHFSSFEIAENIEEAYNIVSQKIEPKYIL